MQPYFGQENNHLHYLDRYGIVICMKTEDIIKDLKNLEDLFDISNSNENHERLVIKTKKILVNLN